MSSSFETGRERIRRPLRAPVLAAILLALGICAATCSVNVPTQDAGGEDNLPPPMEFAVRDLEGREVSLSSYRGQVVLANFWATWCGPCVEEMPLLQELYERHVEQGFVVLGINVSNRPEEAEAFAKQHALSFPILRDALGDVLVDHHINGLPASMLVDRDGRLVRIWIGPLVQSEFEALLLKLLE